MLTIPVDSSSLVASQQTPQVHKDIVLQPSLDNNTNVQNTTRIACETSIPSNTQQLTPSFKTLNKFRQTEQLLKQISAAAAATSRPSAYESSEYFQQANDNVSTSSSEQMKEQIPPSSEPNIEQTSTMHYEPSNRGMEYGSTIGSEQHTQENATFSSLPLSVVTPQILSGFLRSVQENNSTNCGISDSNMEPKDLFLLAEENMHIQGVPASTSGQESVHPLSVYFPSSDGSSIPLPPELWLDSSVLFSGENCVFDANQIQNLNGCNPDQNICESHFDHSRMIQNNCTNLERNDNNIEDPNAINNQNRRSYMSTRGKKYSYKEMVSSSKFQDIDERDDEEESLSDVSYRVSSRVNKKHHIKGSSINNSSHSNGRSLSYKDQMKDHGTHDSACYSTSPGSMVHSSMNLSEINEHNGMGMRPNIHQRRGHVGQAERRRIKTLTEFGAATILWGLSRRMDRKSIAWRIKNGGNRQPRENDPDDWRYSRNNYRDSKRSRTENMAGYLASSRAKRARLDECLAQIGNLFVASSESLDSEQIASHQLQQSISTSDQAHGNIPSSQHYINQNTDSKDYKLSQHGMIILNKNWNNEEDPNLYYNQEEIKMDPNTQISQKPDLQEEKEKDDKSKDLLQLVAEAADMFSSSARRCRPLDTNKDFLSTLSAFCSPFELR